MTVTELERLLHCWTWENKFAHTAHEAKKVAYTYTMKLKCSHSRKKVFAIHLSARLNVKLTDERTSVGRTMKCITSCCARQWEWLRFVYWTAQSATDHMSSQRKPFGMFPIPGADKPFTNAWLVQTCFHVVQSFYSTAEWQHEEVKKQRHHKESPF